MTLTQITEKGIKDGEIVNADINASAAIAGSKISPDFGSQVITTTGNTSIGETLTVTGNNPNITFTDSNNNPDFKIYGSAGSFSILDSTNSATRFLINSIGNIVAGGNLTIGGDLTIDTNTLHVDSSNNRVGIGTTSPSYPLDVIGDGGISVAPSTNSTVGQLSIVGKNSAGGVSAISRIKSNPDGSSNQSHLSIETRNSSSTMVEAMRITSDQNVGIGTTSPATLLHLSRTSTTAYSTTNATNDTTFLIVNAGAAGHATMQFQSVSGGTANTCQATISSFAESDSSKNTALSFSTRRNSDSAVVERMRIDSSGKVGIGETSMDALLVIKGASDASTTPSIRLKDGSDTREAWISNTSGDLILANGGDDNTPHCMLKMFDGNIMQFNTANTERMRIDSSGNVGIGTTSPQSPLTVAGNGDTAIDIVADLDNNGANNWPILNFRRNSVSGTPAARIYQKENDNALIIDNNGSERMRFLAGGGITFNGDTAAANALNDYEEGTYTPAPTDGTAQSSPTDGQYTKIGNFCIVTGSISLNGDATTGGNMFQFTLPFTAGSGRAGSGVIRYSNNSVADTITFHVNAGQASVALYQFGGSSFTFNEASTNRYDFTIMYRTA